MKKTKKKISKNKNYIRGRQWEYYVKKHFEKLGYYVIRKYASKGAEDLVAIKKMIVPSNEISISPNEIKGIAVCSEVLLVQCKNLKAEKPLKRAEAERLITLAKQCGATPLLAFNRNHKLIITEVT